jgi:hypothetical protein
MRERDGRAATIVSSEHAAVAQIENRVASGSTIYADDAGAWNPLHERFLAKRINRQECYSNGEACTNWRSHSPHVSAARKSGIHHKIAGPYLASTRRRWARRSPPQQKRR